MKLHFPFAILRKLDKIDLSVAIDAEIVSFAKMNFCPALSSSQLVAFDDKQVHNSFFIAQIRCSLDIDISLDVAQPSKSIV
jgi:hypothetical protein